MLQACAYVDTIFKYTKNKRDCTEPAMYIRRYFHLHISPYTQKVIAKASKVPCGIAVLGCLRSPDMLAPAMYVSTQKIHRTIFLVAVHYGECLCSPMIPVTPVNRIPKTI